VKGGSKQASLAPEYGDLSSKFETGSMVYHADDGVGMLRLAIGGHRHTVVRTAMTERRDTCTTG